MEWYWLITWAFIWLGFYWVTERLDRIGKMLEHWLPKFTEQHTDDD